MDATRLGQTALVGWRKKVADTLAGPLAARLPLRPEQVRALVGAVFFALAARYVLVTMRNAARQRSER